MSAKPTSLAAPAPASRMVRSESPSARLVRRTLRNRGAQIGAVILLVLIAASLGAPILTSHDPNAIDPTATLPPPSREHPMGTDHIGRDVFARFLYGGRLSLRVGLIAIALGATLGVTIGLIMHGSSVMTGHGPGCQDMLVCADGQIEPVLDAGANIAKILGIR